MNEDQIKNIAKWVGIGFFVLILTFSASSILETNMNGYTQVKQAAISGKMSVRMDAGVYLQLFGKIDTYKRVATVGFGSERSGGSADISAIPVIFNDGSKAFVSGMVRVRLPDTAEGFLALKKEFAGGYEHFVRSGVIPVVKNAVKLSANLRSAQDAYTTLALFQQAIDDQVKNGAYVTRSDVVEITRSTGDVERVKVTVIVRDKNGNPKRLENRITELGCEILECVVGVPEFDNKVEEMIAKRKDEAMKTELAKQEAIRAKQDAITSEEQGKANVAKAKYEKEVDKIKAVTDAQKMYEVAQLDRKTAEEQAKAKLVKKEAEAKANRLLVAAGLTPLDRAKIQKDTAIGVAEQMAKVTFPKLMVIGGEGKNGQVSPFDAVGLESFMRISDKLADSTKK